MHTRTHTRTHAYVYARTQGLGLPSAPVPSSREEKINEDFEKVALLESEQDLVEVCVGVRARVADLSTLFASPR
jgi:hypothetical protein